VPRQHRKFPTPTSYRGALPSDPDSLGQVTVAVKNCAPTDLELTRNDFIGTLKNVTGCETREINPAYIQALARATKRQSTEQIPTAKRQFTEQNVHLNVPEQYKKQYLQVILKNHDAVSQNKFDLGRTDTLMHEIVLKMPKPIYVKQFKIPDAHRQEVKRHMLEWLKLGVIQPACSCYNSPKFAVMKKDGGVRLVQDFRALNNQSYTDKYSMKDVSECIGEIGHSGSTIFSTIDLTAGFFSNDPAPQSMTLHGLHGAWHGPVPMGHQPYGLARLSGKLPTPDGDRRQRPHQCNCLH
jgi:hypothetical protein